MLFHTLHRMCRQNTIAFDGMLSTARHHPPPKKKDENALVFTEAHVQQAVCSPSRTSLLTSRRPDHTRVYDLDHHFR